MEKRRLTSRKRGKYRRRAVIDHFMSKARNLPAKILLHSRGETSSTDAAALRCSHSVEKWHEMIVNRP